MVTVGELTVDSRTEGVSIYGRTDLTWGRQGLLHARALKALLDTIVSDLESDTSVPEKIAVGAKDRQDRPPLRLIDAIGGGRPEFDH